LTTKTNQLILISFWRLIDYKILFITSPNFYFLDIF